MWPECECERVSLLAFLNFKMPSLAESLLVMSRLQVIDAVSSTGLIVTEIDQHTTNGDPEHTVEEDKCCNSGAKTMLGSRVLYSNGRNVYSSWVQRTHHVSQCYIENGSIVHLFIV